MAVPVVAVAAGVGGFLKSKEAARKERNIQDRVQRWQSYPDAQLRDIIKSYGGEAGEAAQRILNARGASAQGPAPTVAERLSDVSPSGGSRDLLIFGGIALLAVLLLARK